MAMIDTPAFDTPKINGSFPLDSAKESNHRIANHLSLLASMVQIQISDVAKGPEHMSREDARSLLQQTASKIVSIGNLHRRLADHPYTDEIDVGDYLIESIKALVSSLSLESKMAVTHKLGRSCRVKAEDAQCLGLIVSEVLINAVKHAHPTGMKVQINLVCDHVSDGRVMVEIGDDGVGLPENFQSCRDGGVGFHLIRALADKLGADLTVESDSLGLTFRLVFPAAL